jgi:hypothetical protein
MGTNMFWNLFSEKSLNLTELTFTTKQALWAIISLFDEIPMKESLLQVIQTTKS